MRAITINLLWLLPTFALTMDILTARVLAAMTAYDAGDARRIHHFLKVYSLAAAIGRLEGLSEAQQRVLEAAALLHDIGIHPAERLHGHCAGPLQEQLGPPEAEQLLRRVGGYSEEEIQRVGFLIAHHHTYTHIDALDWQILVEADFLVNLYEDNESREAAVRVGDRIFRTAAGKQLLSDMLLAPAWTPQMPVAP